MASVLICGRGKRPLGASVEAFVGDRDFAPATRQSYPATYKPLFKTLEPDSGVLLGPRYSQTFRLEAPLVGRGG